MTIYNFYNFYTPSLLASFGTGDISSFAPKPFGENLGGMLGTFIQAAFLIGGLATLGLLIVGGVKWIISQGDKAELTSARDTITNALVGLTIIIASFGATQILGNVFGVQILGQIKWPGPGPIGGPGGPPGGGNGKPPGDGNGGVTPQTCGALYDGCKGKIGWMNDKQCTVLHTFTRCAFTQRCFPSSSDANIYNWSEACWTEFCGASESNKKLCQP